MQAHLDQKTLFAQLNALRFVDIAELEDEQLQMLDKVFYWWGKAIEEACRARGIEPTESIADREAEERFEEALDDPSLKGSYADQDRNEKRYAEQLGKPYPLFTREDQRHAFFADMLVGTFRLERALEKSNREMPKRERRLRRRLKRLGLHLRKARHKHLAWCYWIEDRGRNTTINGPGQDHTFSISEAEAWAEEAPGRAG